MIIARVPIVFRDLRIRNVLCPSENENSKSGVFKFFWSEERFRSNASFSRRINVEGTPNRRNKVQASIFSDVMPTLLYIPTARLVVSL